MNQENENIDNSQTNDINNNNNNNNNQPSPQAEEQRGRASTPNSRTLENRPLRAPLQNKEKYRANNSELDQEQPPQKTQEQRNNENNANTIKNAAEVAKNAPHPYVKAAGHIVSAADKITGGKVSEGLGKVMTKANKMSPGGNKIQNASNKLAESGAGDAIGKVASMKSGGGAAGAADNASKAAKAAETAKKVDNAASNAKKQAAQKAKQQVAEKQKAEIKKKILKALMKNPYFWAILGGVILIIIIVVIIAGDSKSKAGRKYNSDCDFNLTTVQVNSNGDYGTTTMSMEDYIVNTTYAIAHGKTYSDEALKALMVILKTNALAKGNYTNVSKNIIVNEADNASLYNADLDTIVNATITPNAIVSTNNPSFWWPIGSSTTQVVGGKTFATGTPVSTTITSGIGARTIDGKPSNHKGTDIGVSIGTNIIASQSGTVYATNNGCPTTGYYQNPCGGYLGNWVAISHGNNVYTLYGHLQLDTITVKQGDVVTQGQVIGKSGSSGSSTGPHLHFQVEEGCRSSSCFVNPLKYVSTSNTRPGGTENISVAQSISTGDATFDKIKGLYPSIEESLYLSSNYTGTISHLSFADVLELNENVLTRLESSNGAYQNILHYIYSGSTSEARTNYNNNLFIGDSRTGGLQLSGSTSSENTVYQDSQGYNWFVNQAIAAANAKIGGNSNIIIWLGINDLGTTAQTYFDKYYELATESWKNHNIYIVKVGPVDDSRSTYVKNADIDIFNNSMSALINGSGVNNLYYLNINFNINEYTSDGVHYSAADSKNIYNDIIAKVSSGGTFTSSRNVYSLDGNCAYTEAGETIGLSGYDYVNVGNVCKTVKVYNPSSGTYTSEIDFESEYIPGVVMAEVGGFSDSIEVMKLFAIAARSYAIKNLDSSCTIEGSARRQAFIFDNARRQAVINNPSHNITQAAKETYGLVFTKDGKVQTTYYDAACYKGQDADTYWIGYGSETLGSSHIQKIPKSWANSSNIMYYINGSINRNTTCWSNHGYGISQYGAYYLATQQGYNVEQLMSYYLGEGSLSTIYESNYTLVTSSGSNNILTMSLNDFLKSKGTSVEAFNEALLAEIVKNGVGTRKAVVAVATGLVGGLYDKYQVRLPYTMCGQHGCQDMYSNGVNVNRLAESFYGVDPAWGSRISNNSDGMYHFAGYSPYSRYGPDCSGFVTWALHNAGFNASNAGADTQGNYGVKKQLNGSRIGQAGDLMWHGGHIMIVVGVDESKSVYYIAHASGGSEGVKINTVSFNSSNNYIVDMTDYYANNKTNLSKDEFMATFRAGYLRG